MEKLALDGQFSFGIEKEEKRLRLIVYNGSEELVCHKANRLEIKRLIDGNSNHLFKGRLQLDKNDDHIVINVKGNPVGVIGLNEFEELIKHSMATASPQTQP